MESSTSGRAPALSVFVLGDQHHLPVGRPGAHDPDARASARACKQGFTPSPSGARPRSGACESATARACWPPASSSCRASSTASCSASTRASRTSSDSTPCCTGASTICSSRPTPTTSSCGDAPPRGAGLDQRGGVDRRTSPPAAIPTSTRCSRASKSLHDAERKALQSYRDDSAKRHKILGGMLALLEGVRGLMGKMNDSVARALETATRESTATWTSTRSCAARRETAARALTYSAVKLFMVSLLVLGIALGGAFINFQLIALPMSELVPAGARIGGVPVSTISALVIVLMEAAVGFFIMDMLGITDLFPKLAGHPLAQAAPDPGPGAVRALLPRLRRELSRHPAREDRGGGRRS